MLVANVVSQKHSLAVCMQFCFNDVCSGNVMLWVWGGRGERTGLWRLAEVGTPSEQPCVGCRPPARHPCRGETFWWCSCSGALTLLQPLPSKQVQGFPGRCTLQCVWCSVKGRKGICFCLPGIEFLQQGGSICYVTGCSCMLEWSYTFAEAGNTSPVTVLKTTGMCLAIF